MSIIKILVQLWKLEITQQMVTMTIMIINIIRTRPWNTDLPPVARATLLP